MWRDEKFCKEWSDDVGLDGDVFHRHIVKPFIAVAIHELRKWENKSSYFLQSYDLRESHQKFLQNITSIPEEPAFQQYISDYARDTLKGVAFVDFGTGEGYLGRWLTQNGAKYLGLDSSATMRQIAEEKSNDVNGIYFDHFDMNSDDLDIVDKCIADKFDPSDKLYVVICCALESIDSDAVEGFLRKLSSWVRKKSVSHVLLTTLNPNYFLGYRSTRDRGRLNVGNQKCDFLVNGRRWSAYLRSAQEYERIFCESGFHILYQAMPNLGEVGRSKLDEKHFTGPFVTWILRPRNGGVTIDFRERQYDHAAVRDLLSQNSGKVSFTSELVTYGKEEVIEYSGSYCARVYFIEKGRVERIQVIGGMSERGKTVKQEFMEGEIIGEFEAGRNPTSDRFKNQIIAGHKGAELIEVMLTTVLEILEIGEAKFTKKMYDTLRRRMSLYSWTWLDDIQSRATNKEYRSDKLNNKDNTKYDKIKDGVPSDKEINYLVRAILFALAKEGDALQPKPANIIIADQRQFSQFLRLKNLSSDNKRFQNAILYLVQAGVIDTLIWDIKKNILHSRAWIDIVHAGFQSFFESVGEYCDEFAKNIFVYIDKRPVEFHNRFNKLEGYRHLFNRDGNISTTGREIISEVRLISDYNTNYDSRKMEECAKNWIEDLSNIQRTMVCTGTASIFLIRSEASLRDILSTDDPVSFVDAWRRDNGTIKSSVSINEKLEKSINDIRKQEYFEAVVAHLESMWERGERFKSTAEKMNFT